MKKFQNNKYIITVGLLIIALIAICIFIIDKDPENDWIIALEQIFLSAISALIISFLVDIPDLLRKVAEYVSQAMTSTEHLKELEDSKLISTKLRIDNVLHQKSCIASGYFDYINKLEKLGFEPYYDSFTERIVSTRKGDVYEKTVDIKYTLINPVNKIQNTDIVLRKYLEFPKDKSLKDVFKLLKFEISIDGGNYFDIKSCLLISSCDKEVTPNSITYGKKLFVSLHKDYVDCLNEKKIKKHRHDRTDPMYEILTEGGTPAKLNVQYSNKLVVSIKYFQLVPITDRTDTRMLRHLTRNFSFSYVCNDNVKLHGHLISSKYKSDLVNISQNNPNDFSVSYSGWMLPDSGAFLVIDDIVENNRS